MRHKERKQTNKPVLFLHESSNSLMGDELLSEDDDLSNIVFPVKRGGRPILANRQLPLAAHRRRAQACARSLARTSRQAGPRASINAPVARHVSPHARTYAHTRAPQLARGVRHHSRHALLRSCVPSAHRRPHGACVTDAHRPVSTHPPLPRRALVQRAIGCAGQCTASSVEHTWHAGDPRPTRVPADRTAQRSLARIIGSNFGAIFYAPCRRAIAALLYYRSRRRVQRPSAHASNRRHV